MTLPLKSNLGGYPHHWLRRFEATCGRCWSSVLSGLARVHGAMHVVLVRKKDGSLHFCIDFCCFNKCMKKDSYPLPRIQEAFESCLVGAGHFSCLDLKLGFWQIKMEEAWKQYTAFTVGNLGFLNAIACPLGYAMCTGNVSKAYAELPGQVKPHLLPYLPR